MFLDTIQRAQHSVVALDHVNVGLSGPHHHLNNCAKLGTPFPITILRSQLERGTKFVVLSIAVGSLGDENLHEIDLAVAGCVMQWLLVLVMRDGGLVGTPKASIPPAQTTEDT